MARFFLVVACASALLFLVGANHEVNKAKMTKIKAISAATAKIVGDIHLRGPECQRQLAMMAADFIYNLQHSLYALSIAVPNVPREGEEYKLLATISQALGDCLDELQNCLSQDGGQIKQCLATALEGVVELISSIEPTLKQWHNVFVNNQIGLSFNCIAFAVYKIRYQSVFFNKDNDELINEMNASAHVLGETLKSLPPHDGAIKEEVRRTLYHHRVLKARNAYKLKNWVDANHNASAAEVVQQVANSIAQEFARESLASGRRQQVPELSSTIQDGYGSWIGSAKQLTSVKYADETKGQEYIRSILFDLVVAAGVYSENLKGVSH